MSEEASVGGRDHSANVVTVSLGADDRAESAGRAGRAWRPRLRRLAAVCRRHPLSIGLLALLWAIGLCSASIARGPAPGLAVAVGAGVAQWREGRWWFPLTSALWCSGLGSYLATTVLTVALVPVVERRLGSARSAVLLIGIQAVGVSCAVTVLGALGKEAARWAGPGSVGVAVGPAGAVLGLTLAASAALSTLWRRRLRVVLLVVLVMLALYSGLLSDLLRLGTGLVGLGLGACLWRRRPRTEPRATFSKPELRLLLALVVAASALGPLIAAVAHTRVGPLSLLRYVFASPPPDVATVGQLCLDPANAHDCAHLQARLRLHGVGPAVMSAMPVLLLLAAAEGLRLGRRAAWLAAVALNVALTALGVVLAVATATSPRQERLMIGPGHYVHTWLLFVLPLLQPVLVAVLLVIGRGLFRVRAPAGTYRSWARRVGLTLLAVSGLYVAGSLAMPDDYQPMPGFGAVLADLPSRFLPPGYLGAFDPTFLPNRPVTTLLYEWTGVVFWAVVVAGAVHTFARTPTLAAGPKALVRELLAAGGGSLSYPVTWSGNSYWFTEDHSAAIAYRVIGGVAITTGDPIGDRASHRRAVNGFVRYCQDNGWTPCLYAVDHRVIAPLGAHGWHSVQVGEEAVLPLGEVRFTGKRWQNVRTAGNHAAKAGISTEWCRFAEAPAALTDQIRAISGQWLSAKGVPEMGFTLGGLAELADSDVQLLLAIDAQRTVHAVTSWLPVRQDGQLVGYTLDFMRRRTEAFNGVMDFLIAAAMMDCQADGLKFLSLSGAPLARLERGEPATRLQRLLDLLAGALEPIYGFKSLFAFKARFQPSYLPLYLAYPDPIALPKIGWAIAHAYLPRLTPSQAARLCGRLVRDSWAKHRAGRPARRSGTRVSG
ncbi:MAG TPA: DUF2156 domain-containing protein [Pseudonocardia sp.]|uniref:bifunctional lysylphosphatidylglycerol flippase/synthetase MprF n=1 Tax=Pseudonocardia sp. TaxID=60912 RepID=UPI002F405FE5